MARSRLEKELKELADEYSKQAELANLYFLWPAGIGRWVEDDQQNDV